MYSSTRHIAVLLALTILGVGSGAAENLPRRLVEIGIIPVGPSPGYLALTPDESRLYVGSRPVLGEVQAFADVVDTATNMMIMDPIPLGEGFPFQIIITPDGSRAYVLISEASGAVVTSGRNRIEVINLGIDMVTATIEIDPQRSAFGVIGAALTPDASRAYVTHRGGSVVLVADTDPTSLTFNQIVDTIVMTPGSNPVGIDITPDGSRAYAANRATSELTVIDTSTNSFMTNIPLGIGPSMSTTSVAVTPNGMLTYVTYASDSRVAVVDTDLASGTLHNVLERIETGGSSLGQLAVSPDGKFAHATDLVMNGWVYVIDTDPASATFHTVLTRISVGNFPFQIAFQSLPRAVAYVTNIGDGTISVIGFANESITDFIEDMEPDQFSNRSHQKTLLNKMDVVLKMIDQGNLCAAIDKLTHDILPKVDGSSPPKDWVTDTEAQQRLQELIEACIAQLLAQANAGVGCG